MSADGRRNGFIEAGFAIVFAMVVIAIAVATRGAESSLTTLLREFALPILLALVALGFIIVLSNTTR